MTNLLKTSIFVYVVLFLEKGDSTRRSTPTNPFANSQSPFQLPEPSQPELTVSDVNSVEYGICTHGDVARVAQLCESIFFKNIIQKTHPHTCSQLFNAMEQCINSKWDSCFPNVSSSRPHISSEESVSMLNVYSESAYCNDGGLSLPNSKQPVSYCLPEYRSEAEECVRRYRNLFRKNPGHPLMCERYSSAQSCLFRKQDELCEYDNLLWTVMRAMRELYRCWNPFCVWRKRPSWSVGSSIIQSSLADADEPENRSSRRGIPGDCIVNTASSVIEVATISQLDNSRRKVATRVTDSAQTRKVSEVTENKRLATDNEVPYPVIQNRPAVFPRRRLPPGGGANINVPSVRWCVFYVMVVGKFYF